MEVLVYSADNWFDMLTPQEQTLHPSSNSMNGRPMRGDIIEIHEDGFYDIHAYRADKFVVLKVPGETIGTQYLESVSEQTEIDDEGLPVYKLLYNRRYFVDRDKADPDRLAEVLANGFGEGGLAEFEGLISERTI